MNDDMVEENEAIGCLIVIVLITIGTSALGYYIGLPQ